MMPSVKMKTPKTCEDTCHKWQQQENEFYSSWMRRPFGTPPSRWRNRKNNTRPPTKLKSTVSVVVASTSIFFFLLTVGGTQCAAAANANATAYLERATENVATSTPSLQPNTVISVGGVTNISSQSTTSNVWTAEVDNSDNMEKKEEAGHKSRQPKLLIGNDDSFAPALQPDFSSSSSSFGRRISPMTLSQPRPASIIAQPRPFTAEQEPIKSSAVKKRNFLPSSPSSSSSTSSSLGTIKQEEEENAGDAALNRPTFTRKKAKKPKEGDQLSAETNHEFNRAVIRLVSTVPPKPFTGTENTTTTTSSSSSAGTTEVVISTATTSSPASSTGQRRTLLRRLPIRPSNVTRTELEQKSEEVLTTTTSAPSTPTTQLDKMKSRMRIQDSLLSQVQGGFRLRSTTVAPGAGTGTTTSDAKASAVKNDVRMIRRNRVKSKGGVESANVTDTEIISVDLPVSSTTTTPITTSESTTVSITATTSSFTSLPAGTSTSTITFKATDKVEETTLSSTARSSESTPVEPVSSTVEVPTLDLTEQESDPTKIELPSEKLEKAKIFKKSEALFDSKTPAPSAAAGQTFSRNGLARPTLGTRTPVVVASRSFSSTTEASTVPQSSIQTSSPSTTALPPAESSTLLVDANVRLSAEESIFSELSNDSLSDLVAANEGSPIEPPFYSKNVEKTDGLRQELMAAIKRKITQSRTSSSSSTTTTITTATTTFISTTTATTASTSQVRPLQNLIENETEEGLAKTNNGLLSSERPLQQFDVLQSPPSFPSADDKNNPSPNPRVQFFVSVPGEKSVKIPNISHIQGKLARLNAAITEGLETQRKEQEQQKMQEQLIEEDAAGSAFPNASTVAAAIGAAANEATLVTTTTAPDVDTEADTEVTSNVNTKSNIVLSIARNRFTIGNNRGPVEEGVSEVSSSTTTTTRSHTSTTTAPLPPLTSTTTTKFTTTTTEKETEVDVRLPPDTFIEVAVASSTERVIEIYPRPSKEHPTSHYRPPAGGDDDEIAVNLDEEVLVRQQEPNQNSSSQAEEAAGGGGVSDISGTTVYVVGVICIIPAAGLVAWIVRYVVKKRRDFSRVESGSETGLNCAISPEDDLMQINCGGVGRQSASVVAAVAAANHSLVQHLGGGSRGLQQQQLHKDLQDSDSCAEVASQMDHSEISELLCNSAWQFKRQNLRLQTVLGEGNFGKVWKAEADSICGYEGTILVAVKTAKEGAPQKEIGDLLQEMRIMQQIGPHPNVVAMLGVCVEQEPYLLIMEFVMYGKLLQHLRDQRSRQTSFFQFSEGDPQGVVVGGGDSIDGGRHTSPLTAKDLTKYAYGVAKGMEFIVSKGIIHRDLAARNILIDHHKVCKISDFGLSRNLIDTGSEMYEQKTKGALPIRWMAPESLYFSVFTPKSDVWSFGILMWEIVTLGSTPYPGMGAREVMRRVRDGYRLERPSHCHPDLYKIISKCWSGDMNKRPDFAELRMELAKLLEDQHGYIDLQNIPENKYYSMTQNSDEEEKL